MDFSLFNWLGFGLAILANIVIGFVWYATWSPTGRIWIRETKMDMSVKPTGAVMAKSMVLMLLGAVFMMFVFAHTNAVYLDAFRNAGNKGIPSYDLSLMDGVMGGFFTWLGFIVPLNLNGVAFERRSWSLFWVNSGYYLVTLVVAGILIASVGAP